jgi:hypothetical protein
MNHTEVEQPRDVVAKVVHKSKQAEIDENTCRKDFTAGEIYAICEFYYEKLSRQGNNQYTEPSFVLIQNEAKRPIDVIAKIGKKRDLSNMQITPSFGIRTTVNGQET